MKLTAYDTISTILDKNRSWIEPSRCRLVTKEVSYRRYYTLAERLDAKTGLKNYYLILLDDKPEDRFYYITNCDDFGRLKFKLNPIWKESSLFKFTKNTNIILDHIEHTDDGDIYKLDI